MSVEVADFILVVIGGFLIGYILWDMIQAFKRKK